MQLAGSAFIASLLIPAPAFADIIDQLNVIRSQGCDGKPGVSALLRGNRDLAVAVREWAEGGKLGAALDRVEYSLTRAASIHIAGPHIDSRLGALLRKNYCDAVINPAFKEAGVFRRDNAVWIVVAAPAITIKAKDADAVRERVLALVNEARGKPRKCGGTDFEAAPPLKLSAMLSHAALIHSQDMSERNFFGHQGSDGSMVDNRIVRMGYRWRAVGENVAAGSVDAEAVVRGWLESPGHCANIMRAQFTEMGLAYVTNIRSEAGIYWTQVFAAPR